MTQEVEQQAEKQVESDSGFADGFAEVRGTPPAEKEPKAEVKQEAPKAEVEPEKKPEVDPVKAQLDSIQTKLEAFEKIDQRFKSFEGRIHKLTSLVEQTAAAGKAAVAAAPAEEKKAVASKVDAQLEQVRTDFPEIADAVKAAREELRAEMPKAVDVEAIKAEFDKNLKERLAEVEAKTDAQVAQARTLAAIDLKHADWEQTINTPEFESWYRKQAPDIQALSGSSKSADAIRMLDLYGADAEKAKKDLEQKQANDARLARAAAPKGVHGTAAPIQTDNDAFESGFASVRG